MSFARPHIGLHCEHLCRGIERQMPLFAPRQRAACLIARAASNTIRNALGRKPHPSSSGPVASRPSREKPNLAAARLVMMAVSRTPRRCLRCCHEPQHETCRQLLQLRPAFIRVGEFAGSQALITQKLASQTGTSPYHIWPLYPASAARDCGDPPTSYSGVSTPAGSSRRDPPLQTMLALSISGAR